MKLCSQDCFWFVCLSKPNLRKGLLFDFCGLPTCLELWKVAIHDLQEMCSASGDGKSTFPTFVAHFIFLSEKENISRKCILREVGCGGSNFKDMTCTACSSRLTVCFYIYIYICLSCVREMLRMIKVQWTWEDKEQVPLIKYLTKTWPGLSTHSKQIMLLISITFLDCLVVVFARESYNWLIKLSVTQPSILAAFHFSWLGWGPALLVQALACASV